MFTRAASATLATGRLWRSAHTCADGQFSAVEFADALAFACAGSLGLRHGAHGETGTGDGGASHSFTFARLHLLAAKAALMRRCQFRGYQ
jgi:hypothetical protein